MDDCAIFLCCFNNQRIYCLEYTCLIISIIISPCNLLGLLIINWNLINFYYEIIYSINISLSIFSIFIILIIIYSTKVGKIISIEYHKSFAFISVIASSISAYLFITYALSTFEIFNSYLKFYYNKNKDYYSPKENRKIIKMLNSKLTWGLVSLSSIIPSILSFINILLWMSIYLRISYKILCSFNKEVRNELRKQKKINKEFKEFKDDNVKNENGKEKNKYQKDLVSIVIEKDRHPGISIIISNGQNNISSNNNTTINFKNKDKNQEIQNKKNDEEFNQSDISSSVRDFNKKKIQLPKI